MVNMSLRRGDAWPSRLEAESPRGLVPVLILGCQGTARCWTPTAARFGRAGSS